MMIIWTSISQINQGEDKNKIKNNKQRKSNKNLILKMNKVFI